jgi:hypothetical protein
MVVLIDNKLVGHLWLDDRKQFCFQYEQSWIEKSKIPLSLSLPLRDEPYVDDESHHFSPISCRSKKYGRWSPETWEFHLKMILPTWKK